MTMAKCRLNPTSNGRIFLCGVTPTYTQPTPTLVEGSPYLAHREISRRIHILFSLSELLYLQHGIQIC